MLDNLCNFKKRIFLYKCNYSGNMIKNILKYPIYLNIEYCIYNKFFSTLNLKWYSVTIANGILCVM